MTVKKVYILEIEKEVEIDVKKHHELGQLIMNFLCKLYNQDKLEIPLVMDIMWKCYEWTDMETRRQSVDP